MPYFRIYPPTDSLRGIVREIQVFHIRWNEEPGMSRPFLTCLANTEQNLYFYVNDPVKLVPVQNVEVPVPHVVITGPKYKPVGLIFGDDHLMIKVVFRPTGSFRLFNIDMRQTVNNGLDGILLLGNEVEIILNELRTSASYDSMIDRVYAFLEFKMRVYCRPEEPIDAVSVQMTNPVNTCSQEEWATAACLSLRQFERNFTKRTGISPKLFNRIVRFEQVLKLKNLSLDKSWVSTAVDCGYTDASHLFREFREFAEFPPAEFYLKPSSGYSSLPTG